MADEKQKPKSKRGFAAMDPEKQRKIARKGGKSVPDEMRVFSKSADLASAAGLRAEKASLLRTVRSCGTRRLHLRRARKAARPAPVLRR